MRGIRERLYTALKMKDKVVDCSCILSLLAPLVRAGTTTDSSHHSIIAPWIQKTIVRSRININHNGFP